MANDDFDLWLGRIGQDRPLAHRMRAGINRAGGAVSGRRSGFTGARIGRGSGVGRLLSARDRHAGFRGRRVVVKTRIVRLAGKGLGAARAHLRYLQRDGTTREGERGTLYGPDRDVADARAFMERGQEDRHQFRFIVAPEDGAEYDDLKPLVRRLMQQAEQDLGTKLDWVAVDHFNTGHPHSHVIVRGKDDRGKDLVIARDYLTQGLRERATELVELDLGPRTDAEILRSRTREIDQARFTGLDRRLMRSADPEGVVRAAHHDPVEQSLRAGRLQTLGRMGLARQVSPGAWTLDPEIEPILRRMGTRGDIIRSMQQAMREHLPERTPVDHVIYDPANGNAAPVVGRVVARGLSDEHANRHFVIVDALDGRSHYVDIGGSADEIPTEGIVRVSPRPIRIHGFDHTVAEVAAANGGRYSVDAHLMHDPQATEAFAEKHQRRLEAIRRMTGGVVREADGSWRIAPDHLERAGAYEQALAARDPMIVETLSHRPLQTLPTHDGATWLDRELITDQPEKLGRGFGADVRNALAARQQWLVEQQLAEIDGEVTRCRPDVMAQLQQRELRRVAAALHTELGRDFVASEPGDRIEGKLGRAVQVGDRKFALVEKSHEFTLVPWRPVLDRAVGKQVSGLMREGGIDWTIGRSRGPSIGV
jgi:type IV secretory pathway VirD2 relaxase